MINDVCFLATYLCGFALACGAGLAMGIAQRDNNPIIVFAAFFMANSAGAVLASAFWLF